MSKKRTENSKYRSPSTGDFCTAAQYLAEIICQRAAYKENIGTLPYKFWNIDRWKKLYIRQVGLANKLIKKHGNGFITFIKSKRGSKITSLGIKNIEEQYKQYSASIREENLETIVIQPGEKTFSRKSFDNDSLLSRLNKVENGQ